jgi:hypothetical protein
MHPLSRERERVPEGRVREANEANHEREHATQISKTLGR